MPKAFRKMRAGVKLLALLEPIANHLKDECPSCKGKVLLWFDNGGRYKRYYPTGEACLQCEWQRPFEDIKKDAGL